MAKVRKIQATYIEGRGVPAQYTTDPDVATPEQVKSVGDSIDKARRLSRGERITLPLSEIKRLPRPQVSVSRGAQGGIAGTPNAPLGGGAIATSPIGISISGGEQPLYPVDPNTALTPGTVPVGERVESGFRRTRRRSARGAGAIKTGVSFKNLTVENAGVDIPLIGGKPLPAAKSSDTGIGFIPEDLPESYKTSLKMLTTKNALLGTDPNESEEFIRLRELLNRRSQLESEQSRLRSLFRRFDNLYHPTTFTTGGADHWPEDPSARLAGRAHISVNVHPAYVNIPASLQAVRPVINYVASGTDKESRMLAAERERLFFRWWEENDFDLLLEDACTLKSLYGHTAAKVYWDPVSLLPRVSIVEAPENLYLGFGSSDYRRIDWALYVYGLSPQAAKEEFGIDSIPVPNGSTTFLYTSSTTHDDPLASVYRNNLEKNPQRNRSQYELQQVEVYDYWYKVPVSVGLPPVVFNAIFVGNTMVKNEAHPEYGGVLPYLPLINSRIPGSPYGKPELYDVEQLLREKDERMSAQAQMIASTVLGQMWQLVGAEAPDEVPPNAIPKPNRISTPGPGNEIRPITPFIPEFQAEDFNKRIDREIAVVTGLNDLLLGLAPTSVLGSSRAIASLVANYEARLAPKRKLLYSWLKQVWELTGRLWSAKDADAEFIFGNEYRIDIVPPELTPRDTLELAQTAINLVQNRIWSSERAMDRVGVEDPEGEKDVIREEQTDATLNPAAVLTMGQLVALFRQLGVGMPGQPNQMAAQSQNAARQNNPRPQVSEAQGSPEQQPNPPAEQLPENAPQPGVEMAAPQPAPKEGNQ